MDNNSGKERYRFLQNGGDMGQIIERYDWKKSSIGAIDSWPHSLLVTLGNILHSNFPQFLFWGKDLVCFYNDAYRPSLGVDGKHPAIGKPAKTVWPEIWNDIHPLIEQVLTTGKPAWFEDRLLPINRNNKLEDVYWTFCYSAAFDDNGNIGGVLVTCMETTDAVANRKKTEDVSLQQARELETAHGSLVDANIYLQKIINSFKEPLQVLEPITQDGKIVDFRFKLTNAAYSAYANTTPENLYNKKVGDVFPGYFQTTSFTKVLEAFDTGVGATWEIHYDQDGLDLYNEMSAARLADQVVVHFTNFTKLKHLQLELIAKIEELQRSNESLEEFANVASHDLKEPIRKILMYTGQVREKLKSQISDTELKVFEKIENASKRMAHLIDDLIQYAHINSRPLEKENVDLNKTMHATLEDLELVIQQKNATVTISSLPYVRGYDRQLQQLFQNLISNSLKYSRQDVRPAIQVTSATHEEDGKKYHVIEVRDNGIGFDQKYAAKIFDVFTRLHGKGEYDGNGIGLSIVKKIIDNHHGKITAESREGSGSTFSVFLPEG